MAHPALQLRVLSFNIRLAVAAPRQNERPWPERGPLVLNQLQHETRFLDGMPGPRGDKGRDYAASFICLQEVLHGQLIDLLNGLNHLPASSDGNREPANGPIWAHVGAGRDDGRAGGEYSPIFYPVNIFHPLHWETVWLSPTPDRPSKGWDASSIRILTVAVFEHKSSGQRILASTTHLDNDGSKSREESVGVILNTLKRIHDAWGRNCSLPTFLTGDFNSFPNQDAYLALAQSDFLYDIWGFVEPKQRYGDHITFTGFNPEKEKENQGRIDFVWLGPKDAVYDIRKTYEPSYLGGNEKSQLWIVDGYSVLPNIFEDCVYASDHRCIVGDMRLLY